MGLLSLAIWTPIVFGTILLALGRDEHAKAVRWLALVGALWFGELLAGAVIALKDQASVDQFGDQTLPLTSYLFDANLITDLGNWILNTLGTPAVRVSRVQALALAMLGDPVRRGPMESISVCASGHACERRIPSS